MTYRIEISKPAAKEIRTLSKTTVARLLPAIMALATDPRPAGSKKLAGSREPLWRIRTGDYRVIYCVDDTVRVIERPEGGPPQGYLPQMSNIAAILHSFAPMH